MFEIEQLVLTILGEEEGTLVESYRSQPAEKNSKPINPIGLKHIKNLMK